MSDDDDYEDDEPDAACCNPECCWFGPEYEAYGDVCPLCGCDVEIDEGATP